VSQERSFGLQWQLALIYLVVGAGSALAALTAYLAGLHYGLAFPLALGGGFAAGLLVGLAGAVIGSIIARSVKLRLWEAGRMAGCIAGGDYRTRLETGPDDEIGWLEKQLNQMAVQLEEAVNSLRELAEQNRRLGEEAGRGAALEERMRLSRDLHDTVNQQLFVLAMRIAAVRRRLEQTGEASSLFSELESLEELARQAHSQIRELIMEIRPVTLEKEGLGSALKEYLKSMAEREGWQVSDKIDPAVRPEGMVAESLFRIAQEALNNISKHARAKHVEVVLSVGSDQIKLTISDDGAGFDPRQPARPTAVGLTGIRERAELAAGQVRIDSSPGRGTEIEVLVPFAGERNDE
jgi:two-component system, NarL family, sensor histidine kinase LiaS